MCGFWTLGQTILTIVSTKRTRSQDFPTLIRISRFEEWGQLTTDPPLPQHSSSFHEKNMIWEILKGSLTICIHLENRRYLRCINRYTIIGNLCSKVRALALTIRRKYVTGENHVNARESSDIYIMISTRCEISCMMMHLMSFYATFNFQNRNL